MIDKYIGIPHKYGVFDCIRLVHSFYKNELGVSFDIPEYPTSSKWMRQFTTDVVDYQCSKYAKKVLLTDAKNYDLIVFKSARSKFVTHFGIFIAPYSMLHVEENLCSVVEPIHDYWQLRIYSLYRHLDVVQ